MMKTNSLLKRLFSVLAGLVLGASALLAQNTITVRGTILDAEKQPVIGAGVMQSGTTNGASTDLDGHFTITVPAGADLVISAIGYETLTVKATSSTLNITLNEEATQLDETVVVGYGTQKKASLTSAITNIQSEDITSTKQSNLTAALQGKVPGLLIRQQSGAVGWFDDAISLRGYGAPLVIIDGVARGSRQITSHGWGRSTNSSTAALAELNPDDIESITVLKDASASIYGLGAQNGVILVTTKKGQVGTPSISYSTTLTYGVPTALPKEVDVATWMEMDNEMRRNKKGDNPRFSEEYIAHYRNHDPGYEEFSWYDAVMNDHTFSQVHNISVRGGTQQTQYYLSGNYTNQGAIYRADTGDYNRYGLTGNFTTNLTQNLSMTFQTVINVMHQEMPPANTTQNAMYYGLLTQRDIPAEVSPGHYTYNVVEHRNAVALMVSDVAGSQIDNDITFRNNLDVKYNAPFLKGLNVTGSLAYDVSQRNRHNLQLHFPLYDIETDEIAGYNSDMNQVSENWEQRIAYYGRLQAQYNTTIKQDHHIGATFAVEARINKRNALTGSRQFGDFYTHDLLDQGMSSTATNSGTRSDDASAGYVGRLNYDYKGKYLVEVMGRYDGNYRYAPGHRWSLFPSYSVGWRVSEEPFFKAILPKVNNLKLRWSDGFTGQPQGSAYAYLTGYSTNGSSIYNDGSSISGYASHSMASYLSWAKARMMDFGFDFEVWRGLLGGSVDWFWRRTSGIAANSTSKIPDFLGVSIPQQNLNSSENLGIDLSLSHRNTLKNGLTYRLAFSASFARSRSTYQAAEATKTYANSPAYYTGHMIGRWSNAPGSTTYHWLPGNPQFTDLIQIADYPIRYGDMQKMLPGMYMIEDRNGDGSITTADYYRTWQETNPPLQFGLVVSGSYKNFDLSMNFTAATLVNKTVSLSGGMGYGFFSTFYEHYLDRYHVADKNADPYDPNTKWIAGYWPALYPATASYDSRVLTYVSNQPYDFVDGTYLRLKSLEIGYRFQGDFLKKIHLKSLRVYANGTNLLTFCNKLLKPYDPERNQSSYIGVAGTPLMKNFALGVNLNF